jgi:pimeloyl-ACP methyl ester carboxylesterase
VRTLLVLLAACSSSPSPQPQRPEPPRPAPAFKPTSFTVEVTGTGRPVIFIPGLACDGHVWESTVAHLAGHVQAHVISLDGFAGNAPIDKPLLPTVHDELIQYIQQNHLDKPILVGHSLGGFMTYWIAETAPDAIAGAVAVDGAPFLPALLDPKATVQTATAGATMMRDQMASSPDMFKLGVSKFMGSMIREPDKHQALIELSAKSDPKTSADAMFFLMQTDLRGDLPKIKVPMLTIAADTDGQAPRADIETSWKAQLDPIPHHELIVIDHSKHFVMLDQPDAFYAALDGFLAKH